ncbi:MAG: L,D-transpeptidase [Lachnospiraceae bacterium]|nr:L,D-transpeptidase [Lachnospiraceae bacterium]
MSERLDENLMDDFEDVTPAGKESFAEADDFESVGPVRRRAAQPDNAAGRYLEHLDSMDDAEDGFEEIPVSTGNTVADEIRARAAMGDQAYSLAKRRAAERERREAEETGRQAESGSRSGRKRRTGRRTEERSARERYESPYSSSGGRRHGGGGGRVILVLLLLLLVAAAAVVGVYGFKRMKEHNEKVAFYEQHFLPYTMINGIDCTDKTPEEVKQLLESQVDGYQFTLKTLESDEVITGDDADLKLNLAVDMNDILAAQDHADYNREQGSSESVDSAVEINEDKLREKVKAFPEFQDMTETQDAEAAFDEAAGLYVLKEPVTGTKVDVDAVADRVVEAVKSLSDSLDLAEEGFYREPKQPTQEMQDEVDKYNRFLTADVELTFGSAGTEKLPKETILACLTKGEEDLIFDSTAIAVWIAGLADKYDTYKKEHTFTTTNGKTITLSGAYGWLMDQEATRDKVVETVKAGGTLSEAPEYSRTANSHGEDDFGGTYVEVNLNEQHMYYYKEGSCVLDSGVVSGNVAKHNTTPTGLFFVYAKQRDRILHGENNSYNTKVKYWMPFDGGVGLHDAWWRSNFGGSIYKEHGSHGCVNLPSSVAAELYDMISVGTPVIVFGGEQSRGPKPAETKEETTKASEEETAVEETSEQETTAASRDDDSDDRDEEPDEEEQPQETKARETKKETEAPAVDNDDDDDDDDSGNDDSGNDDSGNDDSGNDDSGNDDSGDDSGDDEVVG